MIRGPIFLTGFMGTGKSKIGLLLARRLNRVFADTDRMIEQRAGQTIPEIFASHGEEAFRNVEYQCVVEAAKRRNSVIALGGGAVVAQKNLDVIKGAGVLVCLEADAETILERVDRKDERPLLAGLSRAEKLAKIHQLLEDRTPSYDRADIKIRSTNDQPPESIADQLVDLLEHWYADNTGRN